MKYVMFDPETEFEITPFYQGPNITINVQNDEFSIVTRNKEIQLEDIHLNASVQINKGRFFSLYDSESNIEVIYLAQIVSPDNGLYITRLNSSN